MIFASVSKFDEIFGHVSKFPGQLMDDLFKDHRVNILSKHVQEKPISQLALPNDQVDAFPLNESESQVKKICSESRWDDDEESKQVHQSGQAAQRKQPEPQEDVNLLIEHVYR